jgi:Bacterial protein of unknown function (DUF899)
MARRKAVSRKQWLAARKVLLAKEKRFTKLRDQLSQQRRQLPWVRVDKNYVFDGPTGTETLSDLFEGRSQLIVYHFMFGPDWDAGCKHCSFWADNFNPIIVHLNHRDVSMVAISRAPYEKLSGWAGISSGSRQAGRISISITMSHSRRKKNPRGGRSSITKYKTLIVQIEKESASFSKTLGGMCFTRTPPMSAASIW